MADSSIPLTRETVRRFAAAVLTFTSSEQGWRAKTLFALLLAFLFGINGLNVVNSYVARHFMTGIAERNWSEFVRQAALYVLVFGLSTLAATLYRFTEERLALLWRTWLTGRIISQYLERHVYFRLQLNNDLPNPDQRIADDTRAFTATTLSFMLMFLNAAFTVVAFAGVLWTISAPLFVVAVIYAVLGTACTILLGRPLVWLSYNQSDLEANLRSELIRVRDNASRVALTRSEGQLRSRLAARVETVSENWRRIVGVNRNLTLFSTGYNYMIQIIPALIVAPAYIRGEAEFGVITQAAMAFSQLMGGFSLIVTQFQQISSFAAVVARLGSLAEAVDKLSTARDSDVTMREDPEAIRYEDVTLEAADGSCVLLSNLSLVLTAGQTVSVRGSNDAAVSALFIATAGMWSRGHGVIACPRWGQMVFVPERPYVPPGTLRQLLMSGDGSKLQSDDRITEMLALVGASSAVARVGGLDVERNWDDTLSLAEQQLLVIARAGLFEPRFMLLEQLTSALDNERAHQLLRALTARGITCVVFGSVDAPLKCYDAALEIDGDGSWRWGDTEERTLL